MNPPKPFIVPQKRGRDAVIAILIAVVVLAFVGYGIVHMSKPVQGNKLTGVIVEKQFTPLKEQIVDFSGKTLKGVRESEGEYVLKVRVDGEKPRTYEVPVARQLYDGKKVGDSLTFVRPPSEQR